MPEQRPHPTPVTLVAPTTRRHAEWLEMVREFAADGEEHVDGGAFFGLSVEDLAVPEAFDAWVRGALAHERGEDVPPAWVASTLRWVEQDGRLVGTIHLRHELNDILREQGGHIGYGVRPSARRRGVATAALAAMRRLAAERGMGRLLVTCDDDNAGSIGTIEANGGVLEDVRGGLRRYWVPVVDPAR
ncbi:GNAT family N-acetyltransferase [Lapillicoccus jejuensis]|uniref:Putative acetyltransferase n=1 Tax=Lapillicoccus jejuensis TaxID=402171 RepID=A0A542E6D3_9MICO|nr:GNAT family N-acetyltransferase [Lapillicoccus jejuensis]TQJ10891.1 putative acetyltransferase [Lapillicoccus jejuensis]